MARMGPIDWSAIVLAWAAAAVAGVAFYGRAALPRAPLWQHALAAALLLASATMLGHLYARTGVETLAAKPWLYPMLGGGLALNFICPALLITAVRRERRLREAWFDCAAWLTAYLVMAGVFYLMA